MRFYIFNDAFKKMTLKNVKDYSDYIFNKYVELSEEINKTSKLEESNMDHLYEAICFTSMCEYMIHYGDKHTDGPLKYDKVVLTSAVMYMYDLKKNISDEETEKIINKFHEQSKKGKNDMEVVELLISYNIDNDLNPLYLLLFYYIHFTYKNNIVVKKAKKIKVENETTKGKTTKNISKKKNTSFIDNFKEHKGYYIYNFIFLIYITIFILLSTNTLKSCILFGFGFDFFVCFWIFEYNLINNGNNWTIKTLGIKLLMYVIYTIISLIINSFNPIIPVVIYIISHFYGLIKLQFID